MDDRFLERIERARRGVGEGGLAALLVAPSPDLVYLSDYDPPPLERLTLLVMTPERDPVLLVPALEGPRALGSAIGELLQIETWSDGEDPYSAAARIIPRQGRLGIVDRMLAAHLLGLQRALRDGQFVGGSEVISSLRAVKDGEELGRLARAGRAADETFRRIAQTRLEGRREEEVAGDLAAMLVETGHDSADFTIVAAGPNGASPHHRSGGRTIRPGDAVVMDFGGALGGYFSDTTRTVVVADPPRGFPEVYDVVREAQEAAFRAVHPGVRAEAVDGAARAVIEDAGYAERFIHRTGHGIGLEVHEPPYIVQGNSDPLREGMCFSIEPGIYLGGRFGVRIEDIVTVTADGAQRLNRSTRDLLIVS